MEMHQVRYFLAVCETLNFTRAAEACHVAQPSLTKAVKKLEEELGGELFRRERNQTHLSELGRLMKPHLETIYAASEAAKADADGFRSQDRAGIKLGVMSTIGPGQMVGFLSRLRSELPNLDISIAEAPGRDLVQSLLNGDIEVGRGLPEARALRVHGPLRGPGRAQELPGQGALFLGTGRLGAGPGAGGPGLQHHARIPADPARYRQPPGERAESGAHHLAGDRRRPPPLAGARRHGAAGAEISVAGEGG